MNKIIPILLILIYSCASHKEVIKQNAECTNVPQYYDTANFGNNPTYSYDYKLNIKENNNSICFFSCSPNVRYPAIVFNLVDSSVLVYEADILNEDIDNLRKNIKTYHFKINNYDLIDSMLSVRSVKIVCKEKNMIILITHNSYYLLKIRNNNETRFVEFESQALRNINKYKYIVDQCYLYTKQIK